MLKFQKKLSPPGQPCLPDLFSLAGAENQNSASKIFLFRPPISKKVWNHPPAPCSWEEKDLAENTLLGVWGPITHPKITCKELRRHRKFCADLSNDSKVTTLYAVMHRCADGQTDWLNTKQSTSTREGIFLQMCKVEGGKLLTPSKFLPFHFVKDKDYSAWAVKSEFLSWISQHSEKLSLSLFSWPKYLFFANGFGQFPKKIK